MLVLAPTAKSSAELASTGRGGARTRGVKQVKPNRKGRAGASTHTTVEKRSRHKRPRPNLAAALPGCGAKREVRADAYECAYVLAATTTGCHSPHARHRTAPSPRVPLSSWLAFFPGCWLAAA